MFGEAGNRPDGARVGIHWHDEGELSWASRGTQQVVTDAGAWVVPARFAIWIPSNVAHDGSKQGDGLFHWIKFRPEFTEPFPGRPCAVEVTPALERAMKRVVGGSLSGAEATDVLAVFAAETRDAELRPVLLPLEQPPLLAPILTRLAHEPTDARTVREWATFLRVSPSTLSRAFQHTLGVSFRDVRHRLRLLAALEHLARGDEVAEVAQRIGYQSVSMFVDLFRRKLGVTPGRYFSGA